MLLNEICSHIPPCLHVGVNVGRVKKCPPPLSVCVAGKLIRSGQKSKTSNQISSFLVSRLTLDFSRHASMFGYWTQHTTPTNSSTAEVVITLVTNMYIS